MILQKTMRVSALALMAIGGVACGGGSSSSSSSGIGSGGTVADTTSPSVSFNVTTLTVTSGGTGTSTLTATDNVGVTSGPTVSCTNGGSFASGVFTAPTVTVDTTVVCTATARDAAGNSGSATLTVTIPAPDTAAPILSFSPTTLSVTSAAMATLTLTATDNVGVTSGPTVSCTNGGSFSGTTFTAPAVTANTTVVCTATASDAAGNSGTADLTVTVTPSVAGPDTQAPSLSFNPSTINVDSGSTGSSTLTAIDNVGVTSGPTVTCTNGGSFSGDTFTAPVVTALTTVFCTATASDAAGNSGTATLTAQISPPLPASVTISGKVTFDHVPFDTTTNGLNYAATTQDPAPGVTVVAIDSAGNEIPGTLTSTDGNGDYSLSVAPNINVRIRAKAEMVQTSGAQWDVRVIDNTSADALYSIQGLEVSSGTGDSTRDLNAVSGWGGSGYNIGRAAAPFAILAPIYESIQKVVAVDSDVVLPPAIFNWSVNNKSGGNNIPAGEIGTSSYIGNGRILILGDENSDTDEYDEHVVVHEWGHYFEDQMSRSDSIGGSHGGADRLDPRVALGEGFGNALSGMMTDDPFYRDSFGAGQGSGFQVNVESNTNTNEGWFNEGSVQSILYDIYDSTNESGDTISVGFGPIYNVLTSAAYKDNEYFSTIFSFLERYRADNAADITAVNALATAQSISGTDAAGSGETNNGSIASALPVYKTITVNGPAVEVCSVTTAGEYNKLGNRAYLVFNVANPGAHTLTMSRKSGAATRDPDFTVHRAGTRVGVGFSGTANTETASINLTTAGQHVIDAYDDRNNSTANNGDACYDFTITR